MLAAAAAAVAVFLYILCPFLLCPATAARAINHCHIKEPAAKGKTPKIEIEILLTALVVRTYLLGTYTTIVAIV